MIEEERKDGGERERERERERKGERDRERDRTNCDSGLCCSWRTLKSKAKERKVLVRANTHS